MNSPKTGQRVGYIRVSTVNQNTARQEDDLANLKLDRIFTDKASGKDVARPELSAAITYLRQGDTLVVHSMDRLARNLDDLRKIVKDLTEKGVQVQFLKENLTFSGDDSPMSTLLLSVMGAFAEFERSLIRERQREGIALAKERGAYAGRKPVFTKESFKEVMAKVKANVPKAQIAREHGISRETLYKYLRDLGLES